MDKDNEDALAARQDDFPAFHITLEPSLTGPRYVVRSRQPKSRICLATAWSSLSAYRWSVRTPGVVS
jgi:hypothetical protein